MSTSRPTATRLAPLALLLAACAAPPPNEEHDPWEPFNRVMFDVNIALDEHVLEPTSRGWNAITSEGVREATDRFFLNLRAPISVAGNLLQAEWSHAGTETLRFLANTTVGLLGFFDPAADWGLAPQVEDIGQAFGAWGVRPGPYLVLPVLGPGNPRDFVGLAADYSVGFLSRQRTGVQFAAWALDGVNDRSLAAEQIATAREAALDYYASVRNAFVRWRRAAVADMDMDELNDEEDLYGPVD